MPPGKFTLWLSTVGYRLRQEEISIKPGERVEIEAALSADIARRVYTMQVHADPWELAHDGGATGFTLTGSEAKNLASVLADDPMRALQSAPGVSSNDDFDARFSLHGAPFERVGLYVDGILLHQPFHTVQGEGPSGSLAIFNGDLLETMSLASEAYPVRYGDRTAGILDVQTREGDRDELHFRAAVSAPDVGGLAEGPIGGAHRGSWVISARKSYLQYLLGRTDVDAPSMVFGFTDVQSALSYDLSPSNRVSLRVLDGTSDFDRSSAISQLPLNTAMLARYRSSLANLGWQYTPNASFIMDTHAAYIRDNFRAPGMNSLSGTARGIEFLLQKRTANGLTGWVSYTLGYTNMQDRLSRIQFPSDQDQRHTINAYAGYRIRPSVNLTSKWVYGSGFPIPGFLQKVGDNYFISAARNAARIDPYLRADFRINKSYSFDKWKMTVYAEVVNVLNRDNYRFDNYNGYNAKTGQAYLSFSKMFPVLPSAGIAFDF